jgi:hypothetical protein
MRRLSPFALLGVLVLGSGLGVGLGLSEAPSSVPGDGIAKAPKARPIPISTTQVLACRNWPGHFDVSASGLLRVLPDSDIGRQQALAAFVKSFGPQVFPSGSWNLLSVTGSTALYGTGVVTNLYVVFMRKGADSQWLGGGGQCVPHPYRLGLGWANWQLATPASPSSTTLNVAVREFACSGGQSPAGRVVPPEVIETHYTVVVTFFVRPLRMAAACPTAGSAPYTVRLNHPLGNRTLLDGDTYPPTALHDVRP